jgi:hypothetical protein
MVPPEDRISTRGVLVSCDTCVVSAWCDGVPGDVSGPTHVYCRFSRAAITDGRLDTDEVGQVLVDARR